jgi:hypothetical protein
MPSWKQHYSEILKSEKVPPPWPRMILCALAMGIPLLVGAVNGSVSLAIYGSLTGYLLALNDHFGLLRHRLLVTFLTFILLMGGFFSGYLLRDHPALYQIILAGIVYWIGILGGDGAELERGVLFAVIGMVLIYTSPLLPLNYVPAVLFYCGISLATLLIGIPILSKIQKSIAEIYSPLRKTFQIAFTTKKEKHIHAACYTLMAITSLYVADFLHMQRGYWITMTVLLVMRAERTQSVYKTLQRLIGTALGVLFCDIIAQVITTAPTYIFIGIVCAFLVPWSLKKSYLQASFVMTILIVALLEISSSKFGDMGMPFLRLQATLIGCVLSIIGTGISKLISSVPSELRTKD